MFTSFDRRVVSDRTLAFVRACQGRVPCHLGGGAALSGAHLAHRLSRDIDLFCHNAEDLRFLVRELPALAAACHVPVDIVRDAGSFVRAQLGAGADGVEVDLVYEAVPDIQAPPPPIDGVVIESLVDLRASKLTCLLSRSEPRDLVDLLFLDRAGFPPERDMEIALKKDGGIDPTILAWLLGQFPVRPLPTMLVAFSEAELLAFRDELRERFRRAALP